MQRPFVEPSPTLGGSVFPDEVMLEILARMQVKPLMRFKMVNQAWESAISSKYFGKKLHLPQMEMQNSIGFVIQAQYGFYPLNYILPEEANGQNQRLIGEDDELEDAVASCDGFVVMCNVYDDFWIKNPVTSVVKHITSTEIEFPENCNQATIIFGMGYDEVTEGYKIIRIAHFNTTSFSSEVKVLELQTMEWRRIGDFPYDYPISSPGVYVAGHLHWQVTRSLETYGICSFCLTTEEYGFINLPFGIERIPSYGDIGALDNDRLVVYSSLTFSFEEFELWILETYNDSQSWIRFRFPAGWVIPEGGRVLCIQPLRLLKPENKCILCRIEPLVILVVYNSELRTYETVLEPGEHEEYCTVLPYVHSVMDPRRVLD